MTILVSVVTPPFSENELERLRRVESILARHPYVRAHLGGSGPLVRKLEGVLSMRLALLHTEGLVRPGGEATTLLTKLRGWEAQLVRAAKGEAGSEEALLRYETTLLLHPDPRVEEHPGPGTADLSRLTRDWEQRRANRSPRLVLSEKAKQNRDFFRHGAMLPFYWLRRRRARKLVPKVVLTSPALRETLFAIEQIGPLVDNFAFEGAGGIPIRTSVALADIAFLYMQLADEFLDGLAAAVGGHAAAGRLIRTVYRPDRSARPLRDLSLAHLRENGVDPDAHETRFGITMSALFDALGELGITIDRLVGTATREKADTTHLFLHHCLQTYLDEVDLDEKTAGRADRMPLRDTGWHFYRKNNMVMMLWLDLRARLLGLEPAQHASAIRRWGYLLAAFQIFDDLKDIALDLGRQPSYPLQIAAQEFPTELAWLERRFQARRFPLTRDEIPEVNLRAGRTVRQCMRWSRLIALAHFDNTLLYAWDQRWRKSWTRRRNSFNPPGARVTETRIHAVDRLIRTLLAMRRADPTPSILDDEQLAFALDTIAYEGAWHIHLALFPNLRAMYRFATLQMWMSAEEKAAAARRLLRRYSRVRASALVGLADADVDHEVASDRLEAFSKLMEVERPRRAEPGHRLEQSAPGPGRPFALGVELVHVDATRRERF
ncbi:MAG: hypothetical protein WBM46_14565 [Polyangiales bacterium]